MKSTDNNISEQASLVYASKLGVDAKYRNVFLFFLFLALLALFLPWTQNIRAKGTLTTLYPGERPQELNSIIHGQVEKWYVREGDMVKKGDTILKLTEIKMEYLDPELLNRTEDQIEAKQGSNNAYRQKIIAIEQQRLALENGQRLKTSQAQNKIRQIENYLTADSMALIAAENDLSIADKQLKRQKEMFDKGIKSLTELEQRTIQYQNALAKKVTIENKILALKNEYIIAKTELSAIQMEYNEKISKAMSDEYSTLSNLNQGEGDLAKMKNQFSNYSIRSGFYYVTAPTTGQITRTIKAGIGEIVKEYEHLVTITPSEYHLAVEMFVRPIDVPLLSKGQKVAFQFDGWPAIFFSGWPNVAYGTFLGRVVAIENNISQDGTFRVLVAETTEFQKWPRELRVGGGAQGYALLKDVPIWYEIWRQINSFPPDYYKPHLNKKSDEKKK